MRPSFSKVFLFLALVVVGALLFSSPAPVHAATWTGYPTLQGPLPLDIPKPLPAAPDSLEVWYRTDGPTSVRLMWRDNAFNETGFVVERKKGTGDFAVYGTVASDRTVFFDEYPPSGTELCYRVRAVNALGSSPYSNTVCVNTHGGHPAKPGNLTATVTPEGIQLNWTDNDDTELAYVVMRSTSTGQVRHVASLSPNSTTWLDTEVTRGEMYLYTVRCHNHAGGISKSSANAFTDWITFLPPQAALLETQLPLTEPVSPTQPTPPPPAAGEAPTGTRCRTRLKPKRRRHLAPNGPGWSCVFGSGAPRPASWRTPDPACNR